MTYIKGKQKDTELIPSELQDLLEMALNSLHSIDKNLRKDKIGRVEHELVRVTTLVNTIINNLN